MPSPLWVTVAGDLMAREPQQVSGGRDLSGFTGERTQVSACGIGQAVKQNDGYAAAKKMGGEEAGDVVADQRGMPARFLWLAQVGRDGSGVMDPRRCRSRAGSATVDLCTCAR